MSEKLDVLKTISIPDLRSDLTNSLNEVFYLGNCFIVEKNNEPLGVLVPFSEFQKLKGYTTEATPDEAA